MEDLTVQLQLKTLELNLPKEGLLNNLLKSNRYIYFVLSATTPNSTDQMAIMVFPKDNTLEWGKDMTSYNFTPAGDPSGGLFLLSMAMPTNEIIFARLWVMESKKGLKKIGEVMEGITSFIENKVESNSLFKAVGGVNPIFMSGFDTVDSGLEQLGGILAKTGDKQIGFVSMDQSFNQSPQNSLQNFSCDQKMMSGNGQVSWSWVCSTPVAVS